MQFDMTTWIILGIVAGLTWLILVLAVCKFSEMYNDFKKLKKEVGSNLAIISSNLKASQATVSEMLIEQRRTNKLMLELLTHNKNFLDTLEVEG
jgi:hypothetical protein